MRDLVKPQRKTRVKKFRTLLAVGIGLVFASLGVTACQAQCLELSERVPPLVLQTFAADPASLLAELRNEKEKLAGRLTAYVATDVSMLKAVRRLVSEAPNADRNAIGSGLRRAEMRCLASKPEVSRKINDFVRKLGDNAVLSGYSEEAAELPPDLPTSKAAGAPRSSTDLLTGEWKTELMDPFASIPLPQ